MLKNLKVANLAVVEKADAAFGGGFNVITGETGAGKSVLLGALRLALGARSDPSAVRDGAKEARIEAVFSSSPEIAQILEDAGLEPGEDGDLVIRRTVQAAGGTRVWVNDCSSTVQTLKALSRRLADIHGPKDGQTLVEEPTQRSLLDAYSQSHAKDAYRSAWEALCDARAQLKSLDGDSKDVEAELEMLRFTVGELEAAALTEDDGDDLKERHAAAAHAAEVMEAAGAAVEALTGDEASAAEALISAGARLSEMARHHAGARAWRDQAESLTVQVQELSRAIEDSVSRMDADPETLAALDERLSLVERLKRRHSCHDVGGLIALLERKRERLDELEGRDRRREELAKKVAACEREVEKAGAELSKARRSAAERLSKAVTRELRGLGFLQADFAVNVAAKAPESDGCDTVSYMFAPNPGEGARPLADIASSGETARLMLAVKTCLAAQDLTPLLVFDEIDANIGGEVGRAVGERLKSLASHHQVIAITHLPQSAVYGDVHLLVEKSVASGRTFTAVTPVEGERRAMEIARMLGGGDASGIVAAHARELLGRAEGR